MWKGSLKWNTNKLLSVCIFVGRLSSLLFDNGVFSFLLFDLFLLLLMKSNLLYFDGNGRRATQSFVFLIGVRYPSPSLFVSPPFFFHCKTQKKTKSSSLLHWLWENPISQNKTKQKGRSTVWGMKKTLVSEVNTHPQQKKKKLLHLYIRRPIRHARLTLIFVYYYYVYISAFFFFSNRLHTLFYIIQQQQQHTLSVLLKRNKIQEGFRVFIFILSFSRVLFYRSASRIRIKTTHTNRQMRENRGS